MYRTDFESMGKRKGGLSMDHMFTLTGTTLTVHLPSEVDHHSTELLQRETDQLIQSRNIRCILFDFGDTVFMDSSGIGMLLGRYKMLSLIHICAWQGAAGAESQCEYSGSERIVCGAR